MTSPAIQRWPASLSNPTKTTSTAGQSIPNLTMAWPPACAKPTGGLFRNIGRALELLGGLEDGEAVARQIAEEVEKQSGLCPVLADDNGYHEYESRELSKYIPEELVEKIQRFAVKNAKKETRRSTFQAMEALVHNLNTMHSRAGAQVPFSSINYGTDTSPEGRMVIECILKAEDCRPG